MNDQACRHEGCSQPPGDDEWCYYHSKAESGLIGSRGREANSPRGRVTSIPDLPGYHRVIGGQATTYFALFDPASGPTLEDIAHEARLRATSVGFRSDAIDYVVITTHDVPAGPVIIAQVAVSQ